ncbi:threonine-phosphate decarboxylase [Geothermobacter hydrogeniphilus]|uniref:threonine-phosphate decarboxylase n=1 Tax=Geothermobacter hydrogeniphilus TaxID=1969733 RepID=A0A2K2H6G9_9BACT|nr:threonine-phosphate decarboxylase CobD [Geothermobacter hydrogeniphilus]PNU18841.1 threonine-phosphate decarboxylase [Geothermobacter hydrogeniphilus]
MAPLLNQAAHGGDVFAAAAELGCDPEQILDFSASINPLGPPETVLAAARQALSSCQFYPELAADSLRTALARHHRLPEDCLLPGAGSTELLYLWPRVFRPRRALQIVPAFSEYLRALDQVDCEVERLPWLPGEPFPTTDLPRAVGDCELLVFANPGNPTGGLIRRRDLLATLDLLPEDLPVLVDEAFIDFVPGESLIDQVVERSNLYVLRSMTKFYAIPGLRVGYLAGPADGIARLLGGKEPWTLSTPALAAALACLDEDDFVRASIAAIAAWRDEMGEELSRLGLEVYPGAANYLLVRLRAGGSSAFDIAAGLRRQGILVRDCGNFDGLGGDVLRLAVRRPEENRRLVAGLQRLLDNHGREE